MTALTDPKDWVVLVVDDEADNLDVAVQLLEYKGVTVYTAKNGEEGLRLFVEKQPTMVLADLSMPVRDGWGMLKDIRAVSVSHVPVIAVTAHALVGVRKEVMQAGFDGYISKPFRVSKLMAQLKNIMANMH